MRTLDYTEFYITNVCNLNCDNCNRMNNFAFAGHESWQDYKDLYQEWSKKIAFKKISLLGGEPLLNPDFIDFYRGVLELWPKAFVTVVTNGTQMKRWPGLYDLMYQYRDRTRLEITIHSVERRNSIFQDIQEFLKGPVQRIYSQQYMIDSEWQQAYDAVRGPDWPDCESADKFELLPDWIKKECLEHHNIGRHLWLDSQGVSVDVSVVTKFFTSAAQPNLNTHRISFHNSDPRRAVDICISKHCHHFSRGKLYKCGIAGILPDFLQQFEVDITEEDRALALAYQPAEVDWSDQKLDPFLLNLRTGQPIPQCKFCPEQYDEINFEAGTKKIKLHKIRL